jgi:hydrogenase/urease accessory protein HupE
MSPAAMTVASRMRGASAHDGWMSSELPLTEGVEAPVLGTDA